MCRIRVRGEPLFSLYLSSSNISMTYNKYHLNKSEEIEGVGGGEAGRLSEMGYGLVVGE